MLKMTEFARRRKQLLKKIGEDGIVILKAAPSVSRNNYHEYPYRQNSDFYYLSGFNEPDAVLVLLPKHKDGEFILFNRKKDRDREIWDGHRVGQESACKDFGANKAYPIDELAERLPQLIEGRGQVYCLLGACRSFDDTIISAVNLVRGKLRTGVTIPSTLVDIRPILHDLRLYKSRDEIALMRKAAEISASGHMRAMRFCKPGMNEYQLEAELTYEFQRQGARSHAYTPIVGSGANSCILHYVSNDKPIKNGDLVLIDAGAELDYYASDVTRTFPANGKFTKEQRAIYEIVLAAQLAGIKATRPGTAWNQIENAVIKTLTQGLMDVGLLKGKLDTLIEKQAYLPFYMHRSGHWIGLDVHDPSLYKINDRWRKLEPGMVRTIEPGIYISKDTPGVDKRWHNIGIRIEDDVLVTEKGNEVLSRGVPKEIDDIEALMAE